MLFILQELKLSIFGESLVSIGAGAFSKTNVNTIDLPNSCEELGGSAFANCYNLSSVTLGNSLSIIGSYAFKECDKLSSVLLPQSLDSICPYAFFRSGITSINIPDKIKTIPYGC